MSVGALARGLPVAPRARVAHRLYGFLAAESILVASGAALVFFWAIAARSLLGNDSWMTIAGGREIVQHGIPHRNAVTLMTLGKHVVDQQWLSQVAFWGIFSAGGIRLALLATIALLLAPVALALVLARRRGASATSIVPFALLPILDFSSILRAQVFSQLLFVMLLGLLATESRRPSRRVALAFPLLVLWANMHGAALIGAGLVTVLGLVEGYGIRRRAPGRRVTLAARAGALVVLPWLCLLATPYGLATASYYPTIMNNPILRQIEGEWRPPVVASAMGFALFALAGAALVLVARRHRDLTGFELATLAFTLAGAVLAVRSIPWFAYSCLVFLPPLFERSWRRSQPQPPPARLALAVVCAMTAIAGAALAVTLTRPASYLAPTWPAGAAASVERVLRDDPRARVYASYEYPDWLLLSVPAARGRVAYDGRFELLSQRQLHGVMNYLWQVGDNWERSAAGYRLLVLNPQLEHGLVRTYAHRPSARVVYRDKQIVVYDLGPAADS